MGSQTAIIYAPPKDGVEQPLLFRTAPLVDCAFVQLSAEQLQQAKDFIALWQLCEVSRYNRWHSQPELPEQYVLIVWQDKIPAALQLQLLEQAAAQAKAYAIRTVVICHEHNDGMDLTTNHQRWLRSNPELEFVTDTAQMHHAILLKMAAVVICADSWLGFEALLWRKPVVALKDCFFQRLTLQPNVHRATLSIESEVYCVEQWVWHLCIESLFRYNYETVKPCVDQDVRSALQWLQLQRQNRQRFDPVVYAIGFNFHWRQVVRTFIQGSLVHFVRNAEQVPAGCQAVIWGAKKFTAALKPGVKLIRLEDGFLRSVGLGIQFSQPLSWVADEQGLYFDATVPSALETLLNQHPLDMPWQQQARSLIELLVSNQISKYNTGVLQWQRPETDKQLILVVGQVESDASIALGASDIKTNLALLQKVRSTQPNAFIIYKPHPDVIAGARAAGKDEQLAAQYCDLVLTDIHIAAVIAQVDAVHVMTSLAGFEALLRGKPVYCYGLPFYAGWGLTTDYCRSERRQRRLMLTQLVAATLLIYPLYISKHSGYYCTTEQTLLELKEWRQQQPQRAFNIGALARKLINRIVGTK